MKRQSFILIILIFLGVNKIFATGQVADLLIIDKDTFAIFSNPLEPYLEKIGNRDFPEFKGCGSTACWRGYQAVWTIENDSLFLLSIQSCHKGRFCQDTKDANLKLMFAEKYVNKRVFAEWFSGTIRQPIGKLIWYIHMGYGSIYESDKFYEITNGIIERKYQIDNLVPDSTRLSISKRDTISRLLYSKIENSFDWEDINPSEYDTITWVDIDFIFSKSGKLKRVKNSFDDYQREPEDNFFERIELTYWKYTDSDYWFGKKIARRIKRTVKNFPKVEILKINEKRINLRIRLWLKFDFKQKKIEWLNDYN